MEDENRMPAIAAGDDPTDSEVEEGEAESKRLLSEAIDWDSIPKTDSTRMYMASIGRFPILEREEEMRLAAAARSGDRSAREKLICSNLKLVVSIAKAKIGKGVDFDDLIQDGNMGLMEAVKRFDETKGYRFSTYATWWIKDAIARSIDERSRAIRLPAHVIDEMNFVKKALSELGAALGREPDGEEVCTYMGGQLRESRFNELMEISRNQATSSLDADCGHDGRSTVGDITEDTSVNLSEKAYESDRDSAIDAVLGGFKPIQRRVLELRYGLLDGESKTLDETAETLYAEGFKSKKGDSRLSKERIRQIEAETIAAIQANPESMERLRGVM